MATFKVQIEDLTGAVNDDSALTQWLTDGAKEIINILPAKLKEKCASISILNATNGTTLDMDSGDNGRFGEIIQVTRLSADSGGYYTPCRKLHFMYGDLANDSSSIYYASATDPAYWVTSNSSGASTLFVKPTTTNAQPANVYRVAYPSVAHGDSVVANFPDEAEYLVVLYASIKGLQRLQNDLSSNSDITTAFTAINTELDETQGVCDLINTQVDSAVTEIAKAVTEAAEIVVQTDNSGDFETALDAINTALDKFRADGSDPALFGDDSTYDTSNSEMTRVKDALDKARNLIDGATMSGDTEPESVQYWLNDEDTEMVQATLQTAQTEIQRAQTHVAEWNATVQALTAEADGFSKEVQARAAFTGAKSQAIQSIVSEASAYLQAAQGYGAEIQAKINIAQGYVAESNARMARDTQKYQWYQSQQVKLQQDYDKGVQMLIGQHMPAQPAKGEQ